MIILSGEVNALVTTIYPNPQWGYGIVNMKNIFDNIRLKVNVYMDDMDIGNKKTTYKHEYYVGNLFIRLPKSYLSLKNNYQNNFN